MASKLDADIDGLYQLPLGEFTTARNALAKEAGPAAARQIRALPKPPVPAWAVNQVYWKKRPVYDALIDAASALHSAHSAVLSGKKADLRSTGKEHEEALENALKAALDVLADAGNPATESTRQAIATTLRGLPAEEPPGRLARTLQPGGFEMLSGIPVRAAPAASGRVTTLPRASHTSARSPAKEEKPQKLTAADTTAIARAREALTSATREMKAVEHAARREEFEAARAAREVEKAARQVQSAREQLEAAQQTLDEAEREAAAAEKKRDAAQRRADQAESTLATARDRVRGAERALEKLTRA